MLSSFKNISGKVVRMIEVSPRDGLQNMAPKSFEKRLEFLKLLNNYNFYHLEVGALVKLPSMKDSDKLYQQIEQKTNTEYSLLALNQTGFLKSELIKPKYLSLGLSPSEKFCQANVKKSVSEVLSETEKMISYAKSQEIKVRGYISTAVYCPFEGRIDPKAVADQALFLKEQGCYEISLGDTTGESNYAQTRQLLEQVLQVLPPDMIAGHFHDTFDLALTNVIVSLDMGVTAFDSSVCGLGGWFKS